MEKQKLCGSTSDLAEMVVDYKNRVTEIKGVPEYNVMDTLSSSFRAWFNYIIWPYLLICLVLYWGVLFIFDMKIEYVHLVGGYFFIITTLTLCHLNKRFDRKFKRFFAIRTGNGKRNRIKVTNFKTKEFVLYGIKNIVVEFEATGDVGKKLNKVWIKEEHPSSYIRNQTNIDDMLLLENDPTWNCYFIFEEIPKDGSLYVEWI